MPPGQFGTKRDDPSAEQGLALVKLHRAETGSTIDPWAVGLKDGVKQAGILTAAFLRSFPPGPTVMD